MAAGIAVRPAGERDQADRREARKRPQTTATFVAARRLGGGSTDAAAALRVLSTLWRHPLDEQSLAALALELGADVPACLAGRPIWVGGVGDDLQPAMDLPPAGIVLANPRRPLPTADVF